MKAAVLHGPEDLRLEERALPAPAANELLIRVAACAICGSDLRTYRFGAGNITGPVVVGHEIAGTIVEAGGALTGWNPGERVAIAPAVPCCDCIYCRRGMQTMCNNLRSIGYQFDGGFADYMIVPWAAVRAGCVNRVPENLSLDQAALAEPLACVINGQELLGVGLDDTVVILGAGPIGCLHADLARVRGAAKVVVVDVQEHRLEMARAFAVDTVIDGGREDVLARVRQETEGEGASVVIVAAPAAKAQEQAITLAAKRGRISFFGGLPKTDPCASVNSNLVHYRELFVMGAYGSMPRHNRTALDLLASGRIHAASLVGLTVPLERLLDGYEAAAGGRVLKVVVRPQA
ncbi:MAG: zinc-dependent dehydrogenase [Bryobacteraceae bacterium]|jgi:L-iditol 2-dehydrogenase